MSRQKSFSDLIGKPHQTPYIICSAIHVTNGTICKSQPYNISSGFVVSGRRHSDCYSTLTILGYELDTNYTDIQGFVTSDNLFVDRHEAFEIAVKSGQVEDRENKFLISEDLY